MDTRSKRWISDLWRSGWVEHAARTAVAGAASLGLARLTRMPQAYWASISAMIVMQSTLGAVWAVSKQRFMGTALGAAAGGGLALLVPSGIVVFGMSIFALGLLCALLRMDRAAYRFAAVAFAIVVLVASPDQPLAVALHRFFEVSIGIAVTLVLAALWPGREPAPRHAKRSP